MPTEKKDLENSKAMNPEAQDSPKETEANQQEALNAEKKPDKKGGGDVKETGAPAPAVQKEDIQEKKEKIEAKPEKEPETAKGGVPSEEGSSEPEKLIFSRPDEYAGIRKDLPEIKIGDVIMVSYRVIEGGKERIQVFEGIVIARKNSSISKTITVRKTSFGVAVERIFPLNSKLIQKIQVKKHSKVRRAKLYYLRELKGKAARLKELR